MDIIKVVSIGIVCAVLAITLKKTNPELAIHVSMAAGILIALMLISYLSETVAFIKEIAAKYSFAYESVLIVLKITGIAYICEFAVSVLKDAGESSIGNKVELAGKLVILVLTLPMIRNFFDAITGLMP